jgi:hypothetical protein
VPVARQLAKSAKQRQAELFLVLMPTAQGLGKHQDLRARRQMLLERNAQQRTLLLPLEQERVKKVKT